MENIELDLLLFSVYSYCHLNGFLFSFFRVDSSDRDFSFQCVLLLVDVFKGLEER